MENQEAHQSTISEAEFNRPKDELKGLTWMMAAMMRRLETDPSQLVIHDSSSGPSFLQLENLYPKCKVSQTLQHIPIPEHIMTLQ